MALAGLPTGAEKAVAVRRMFDRIAPGYDGMNRLISLGLDRNWRSAALARVGVGPGDRVVDVACGTGDLGAACAVRGARVVGVDFAGEMLRRARLRHPALPWLQGDASRLPVADGWATVVTCGFALRNFVSAPAAFAEMARVLAPGGRLAIVEVDRPRSAWLRPFHQLYFDRVVPWLGARFADAEAYAYLPRSTAYLPEPAVLRGWLADAGFDAVVSRSRMLGAVQILTGAKG